MELWQYRTVIRDGVNLVTRRCGNPERPTLLFVHGYPDNSEVWDRVAEYLVRDYHLVSYDVRGAGGSSAPRGLAAYRLEELSADLFAVIEAVSPDRPVHLVAHDWGSIQAWEAVTEPAAEKRIASYTTLSGPCLDHVGRSLRQTGDLTSSLRQLAKSWYIAAFHLPVLAPLAWKFGLAKAWPMILKHTERLAAADNPTQGRDGARGVALYRANMLPRLLHPRERRTRVPVQQLVALKDRYVAPHLAETAEPWTDTLWRRSLNTGHWGPLLGHPHSTAAYLREFVDHMEGGPASGDLTRSRLAEPGAPALTRRRAGLEVNP